MLARITICGLGPGGEGDLTEAAASAIAEADRIFVRTSRHPTAHRVASAQSFDHIYDAADELSDVYGQIADELVKAASNADGAKVLYVVPGSPLVLERSVSHLIADERIEVDLIPSLSFLDVAYARLAIDPVEAGVRLVDGHTFARDAAGERGPLLVAHAHASWVLSDIKLAIDAGDEQKVVVLQGLGTPDEKIFELEWPELDRSFEPDHLTSLYIPEVVSPVARELQQSVELMHRLRQDCPWDQKQTHESLRRYLIEEAYEVLEAIDEVIAEDEDGPAHLEEELGDLWFQILFHAELATERGEFTIADVARNVHDKLVARHPHVFGETEVSDADEVVANWEAIKKEEKGRESIMDGIPAALPALIYAEKILKKGARSDAAADDAGLARALDNLSFSNVSASDQVAGGEAAIGQLLLGVVEVARRAGIDPEGALRQAATEARQRFQAAEATSTISSAWVFG